MVAILQASCAFAQAEVLTGKIVADELRGIIDQAQGGAEILVGEVGKQAQATLERLEKLLGDKITTPIDQLDTSLRAEISAARGIATALKGTLDSLPKCIGNEAQLLIAGLKSGLNTSISSLPLVKGVPIVYLVHDASRNVPYVLKHTAEMGDRHLIARGANLWNSDDLCEITAKAEGFNVDTSLELPVIASDVEKVDLRMPASISAGQYMLKITARKKRWFGCSKPKTVSAGFSVVPPQEVTLTLTATTSCKQYERHRTRGVVQESNNGCNTNNERESRLISFDRPGFTLERFDFNDESNSRGSARAERSGNGVQVTVSAQGRGNTCSHGTGRGRGVVVLHGVKQIESKLSNEIEVLEEVVVGQGSSLPFALPSTAEGCDVDAYVIKGEGRFAGGTPLALPPMTVATNKEQTSSENGVRAFFSGSSRAGTIALDGSCL